MEKNAPLHGGTRLGAGLWALVACLILIGPVMVLMALYGSFERPEQLHPELTENLTWGYYRFSIWAGVNLRNLLSVLMGVALIVGRERGIIKWTVWAVWVLYPGYILFQEFLLPMLLFDAPYVDRGAAMLHLGVALAFAAAVSIYLLRSRHVADLYCSK